MKKIVLLLCTIFLLATPFCVFADGVDDMLDGKQDHIILGSVKDITDNIVTITVDHELGYSASPMVGKDIKVSRFAYSYCEEHSTSEFRNPIVSDNVVISLNDDGSMYSMANCAYKVDSNEYASVKIKVLENIYDNKCTTDLLKTTCFIRCNAMVNEFEFDPEGRIYAVYPQTVEQCVSVAGDSSEQQSPDEVIDTIPGATNASDKSAAAYEINNTRSTIAIVIFILGAILGMVVAYIIYTRKNKKGNVK